MSSLCTVYVEGHTLLALPTALGDLAAVLLDVWRASKSLQGIFHALTRPDSGNLNESTDTLARVLSSEPSSHRGSRNGDAQDDAAVLRTGLQCVSARLSVRTRLRCACTEVTLADMMVKIADWCLGHMRVVLGWRSIGQIHKKSLQHAVDAVREVRDELPNDVGMKDMLKVSIFFL